jgi:hypothetical protein
MRATSTGKVNYRHQKGVALREVWSVAKIITARATCRVVVRRAKPEAPWSGMQARAVDFTHLLAQHSSEHKLG